MQQSLRYSRFKLGAVAFTCAAGVCFCLVLFMRDGARVPGPFGGIVSGDLGHFIVLPILILLLLVCTIRAGVMAFGSLDAVVTDERMVRVITAWRSHEIEWSDLQQIGLVISKFRNQTGYTIKFYRYNAATVSLPLGALALQEREYESAFQRLLSAHGKATSVSKNHSCRTTRQPIDGQATSQRSRSTFGRKQT